jgi:hypothetical protein
VATSEYSLSEFSVMSGKAGRKGSTNEKEGVLLKRGSMVHYWHERIFSLKVLEYPYWLNILSRTIPIGCIFVPEFVLECPY